MSIEELVSISLLMLVIGFSMMIKGFRKLHEAKLLAAKVRCELEECAQARQELQEFAVLFNYGARDEAYEHLRACGFRTAEPARPQRSA